MAKLRDLLGINSRAADYLRLNKKSARRKADDKLSTKRMLRRGQIPHPKVLQKIKKREEIGLVDWSKFESGFVIKPAQGLGGSGVMVVRRKFKDKNKWVLVGGGEVGAEDLRLHVSDIIEGRFSRNGLPDVAMVEERVRIHPKFRKLAVGGTPDVRVIVYNRVPVMAMLRLPTEESGGKANLHQGALGLGIDMATGITTHGVYKDRPIRFLPDTDRKVNGIAIPHWNEILHLAVQTQIVSKLSYLSVDFLIDLEKGPLVLELNDQPGLSIQIANRIGLKRRLEQVEGLEVESAEKGVRIAKTLFASQFASRVRLADVEKKVVGVFETVKIRTGKKKRAAVPAKIDTGALSTSIDESLAKELGLLATENILLAKKFKSSLGEQERPVVRFVFWLRGKKIVTRASITHRKELRRMVIIGRRDLKEFLVDAADVSDK
ncbi:MAG: sugar-transfer associated ATP-grasp domain-containing protein [Microgenomates group bacterium]